MLSETVTHYQIKRSAELDIVNGTDIRDTVIKLRIRRRAETVTIELSVAYADQSVDG